VDRMFVTWRSRSVTPSLPMVAFRGPATRSFFLQQDRDCRSRARQHLLLKWVQAVRGYGKASTGRMQDSALNLECETV
jgi:hypothetical protein